MNYFSKSHVFLYSVILIGIFVLYKTVSLPYHGVITVKVSQQKGAIHTIDTLRTLHPISRTFSIDKLKFPHSKTLSHDRLGMLGFSNNFFIDAQVNMEVHQKGLYMFRVSSDDGFRLTMDNVLICEHIKDRPYQTTTCKVNISEGNHLFDLDYFQGGGPLGLYVQYSKDKKTFYDLGEDTDMITFKEVKHD